MSEIFVEEENTVYELDAECLKRKEEQKRRQRDSKEIRNKNSYHAQKTKSAEYMDFMPAIFNRTIIKMRMPV